MNDLAGLAPLVLIALVFWLLLIRPQRRRQQELMSLQRGIVPGDEVMLGAGIFGRVTEADSDHLRLEVQPGVQIKVARQAVARVVSAEADSSGPAVGESPAVDPDSARDATRDH